MLYQVRKFLPGRRPHVTAPDHAVSSQKVLARAPSTRDPKRTWPPQCRRSTAGLAGNPEKSYYQRRSGCRRGYSFNFVTIGKSMKANAVRRGWSLLTCGVALVGALASTAWAQEVLPFPPKPSGSTAGRTIQDSIYSPLPAESHLPKDAPNILIVLI